jgi:glucokinase
VAGAVGPLLLAGDIGGTKTVLAAVRPDGDAWAPVAQARFENREYDGLEAIVGEFLARHPLPVRAAALSVAGLVSDGRAVVTNLSWSIDSARLRDAFGLSSVLMLNDLEATAYAIPALRREQICTLQPGVPATAAACLHAVIAPGTGLGEAVLRTDPGGAEAWPSEGGNTDFAPADDEQIELLRYLRPRFGHVSFEQVCSGLGIRNLYAFLKDTGREPEPAWLAERLAAAPDPTPVIATAALEGRADAAICARAMGLFVDILGAEAGSMALRLLPQGGVYVGGGIPPRILPLLRDGRFLRAFRAKGRYDELMPSFGVHVILDANAATRGAARRALAVGA